MSQPLSEDEIAKATGALRAHGTFPIDSHEALVAALGGEGAQVHYRGRPYSVKKWARQVPERYFPIASLEDFVAKAKDADHHVSRIKALKQGQRPEKPAK